MLLEFLKLFGGNAGVEDTGIIVGGGSEKVPAVLGGLY